MLTIIYKSSKPNDQQELKQYYNDREFHLLPRKTATNESSTKKLRFCPGHTQISSKCQLFRERLRKNLRQKLIPPYEMITHEYSLVLVDKQFMILIIGLLSLDCLVFLFSSMQITRITTTTRTIAQKRFLKHVAAYCCSEYFETNVRRNYNESL